MKRILLMAIKDLKLLSRDRVGMFFIVAFPILMGVFFGFVMGRVGQKGSTKVSLAVVDQDRSPMSLRFLKSLQSDPQVNVQTLPRDEAMDAVRRGKLVGMIVLPERFGESAGILWAKQSEIEVGLDPSRTAESAMLEGMIMRSMGELINARFQDPQSMRSAIADFRTQVSKDQSIPIASRTVIAGFLGTVDAFLKSLAEANDQVNSSDDDPGVAATDADRITTNSENVAVVGNGTTTTSGNSTGLRLANIKRIDVTRDVEPGSQAALMQNIRSRWDISFPQSVVWGILGCVAGFATLMVREQSIGTLTRLQVAPFPQWHILAAKGVGCFIAVSGVVMLMMLVGTFLGMRPGNWLHLVMAAISTAICFVGIMMLLSLLGRTEQAVSGAAWGACVIMAMFGGGMIPVAFMPDFMKSLSNLDPVKWAVISIEGAVWRGFSLTEMLVPCGILMGTGVVSTLLGSVLITQRSRR
ncbi:MAG: ABC transporter permease [Planctomycetaceae bacterium]|nr:ABC transporter permease [Planctomycetaceae bacterium]